MKSNLVFAVLGCLFGVSTQSASAVTVLYSWTGDDLGYTVAGTLTYDVPIPPRPGEPVSSGLVYDETPGVTFDFALVPEPCTVALFRSRDWP